MFKEEGDISTIKIIDFGFAQFIDEEEFILQSCGSAGFMAPE